MKNKLQQNNKKGQHKVLNVSKPPMNVRNRDQLRKKLKGLLDKHVLSPVQNATKKVDSSGNIDQNHGSLNERSNITATKKSKQNGKNKNSNGIPLIQKKTVDPKLKNQGGKNSLIKTKVPKKNNKFVTSNDDNSKGNYVSFKTKPKAEVELLKKVTKTSEHSQTSDDTIGKKKQKFGSNENQTKHLKNPKKKTDKGKAKLVDETTKKDKQPNIKSKCVSTQTLTKRVKYIQGQGPLRPQTSESEFDADLDSSPRPLKRKSHNVIVSESEIEIDSSPKTKQKVPNAEQALVRAENEFEDSCSNNHNNGSCFNFLFDESYSYSEETTSCSISNSESDYSEDEGSMVSEYDSPGYAYSDNESSNSELSESYEYSSDFCGSDDDDSYEPPENLLEDVYIAKGEAVKYDMSTDDIGFDSDSQCAQIIEMPPKTTNEEKSSTINQPQLIASKSNQVNKTTFINDEEPMLDSDDSSCPELIPIEQMSDTEIYDTSSCDSSHSCCSSCDCGSCDESVHSSNSEKQYQPMTPEVIKAKAEFNEEMETFFNTKSNDPQTKTTSKSILEEINTSLYNPKQFKVYTINNEILNNDSFSSESSKIPVKRSKKVVSANSEDSCTTIKQKINETRQKIIDEKANFNKKAKIRHSSPSDNKMPSCNSFETLEESIEFNKRDESNTTKPSQPKTPIRTLFFNAINCNQVIVLLKDPLYIYGTVKLKLLAGCCEIFGYTPKRNEMLELFSPRGYRSLKIEPSHSNVNVALNEKELLSLEPFFIRSDLEEILKEFDSAKDAIIILERNDKSKKVNMLRKYMVEHLFPNMNSIQSDRPFYTSEFLLRCIITPNTDNLLLINPDWNAIPVQNNSKIMIIGGKSVGKSTLVRYLVNKNLKEHQKIVLVDLDIGQPEMFVPQTISVTTLTAPLLGPGYFLNKQPDKSFLVGHFSIINSLEAYIESLKALLDYCNGNSDYKDIPWIINTMGYNKGFGDELISVICSLLHPSNIVQFESDREINDFDIIMIKDNVKSIERNIVGEMCKPINEYVPQHQLTLIKSLIPKSRNPRNEITVKPRDIRLAMILSRLSSILTGHAEWITDVKPFCASIDDLNIINMGDDQIGKEDLVKTLVGNLVYLCRMESGKAHECFGIGIVRGVDYPLRQIYLLPTVPLDFLTNVNCLAICGIPLPSSILLKQGPKVKGPASYVYNTLDEAASMYIMQMYNKPHQFPIGKR